jgi:hypothetical protein
MWFSVRRLKASLPVDAGGAVTVVVTVPVSPLVLSSYVMVSLLDLCCEECSR